VAIGFGASGYSSGVAVGYWASGESYGTAVGYNALGDYYGAAVGDSADGYYYGAAVGAGADGDSHGAAVGVYTNGSAAGVAVGAYAMGYTYGAAVGYNAYGDSHGAAVGAYALGDSYGAAVGYNAYGHTYGAAVGAYANGMRYGAALGYMAGYNIDTTADRYNVLVGAYSGYRLTTGIGNIIIGYGAGYDSTYSPTTGSYNILIGYNAWTPATTTSNFLNIGGLIFGTNISTTTNTISSGNVGIGTTTPAYKLTVDGDLFVSATSTLGSATSTPVIFGGYVQSNIIPYFDNQYTLGLSNYRWANIFAATGTFGGTITIGTNTIQGSATTTLFTTGNTNQLVLGANGNVGIGEPLPSQKLTVSGGILATGNLTIQGLTNLATTTISSGNVGIGTTDVTAKLTIQNLDTNQASLLIKQSGSLFQKTIGGTGDDYGYSIQQTSDGGYVITGETSSFGAGYSDVFVIKLDSSGNLSWAKTIGGTYSDYGYSIQQTSDGGYVITGETSSFGAGYYDVFVIKLDSSGNLSWAKTIGGTSWDYGYSIQQTSDGGYVITGGTYSFGAGYSDVFVIKLDSSGNLSWAKTIGGTGWDYGFSIQQTSDGGYVITGRTYSFGAGYSDVFVIKLDSSGNLSWAKTIGGTSWDLVTPSNKPQMEDM